MLSLGHEVPYKDSPGLTWEGTLKELQRPEEVKKLVEDWILTALRKIPEADWHCTTRAHVLPKGAKTSKQIVFSKNRRRNARDG